MSSEEQRKSTEDWLASLARGGKTLQSGEPTTSDLATALMGRIEVKNLWYNGQHVQLDGYKFIGCRFDNCTLQINTSNFELVGCHVDQATTGILYSGGLQKVVRLFLGRYPWAAQYFPSNFVPTANPDGTVTIDDRWT